MRGGETPSEPLASPLAASVVLWIGAAAAFLPYFALRPALSPEATGWIAILAAPPAIWMLARAHLVAARPARPLMAALRLVAALLVVHVPADWLFLSRLAPELVERLAGWMGIAFYASFVLVPPLAALVPGRSAR